MSERRSSLILPLWAFALTGLLFAAMEIKSQGQQPEPTKAAASDSSCIYDFERGVISDCIQKAASGKLIIKQQVLKHLKFDSHGLAAVRSETNGWMYVSRTGEVVIRGVPTMDNWADTFHGGLVRVVRNNKYGFSNRKGQLVISAVYDRHQRDSRFSHTGRELNLNSLRSLHSPHVPYPAHQYCPE